MDKEKQELFKAEDSSYDSDAEDLLKDLEDDDDDSFDFGAPKLKPQQSLVNILSSSSDLSPIAFTSYSELSRTTTALDAPAESTTLPLRTDSPSPARENETSDDTQDPGLAADHDPEPQTAAAAPIGNFTKEEPKRIDAKKDDSIIPPLAKPLNSIKPFEVKPVEKIEPLKESSEKSNKLDSERISVDENSRAANSSGRRPPVPPKMSSASIPSSPAAPASLPNAAVIAKQTKDGETLYTQEELNDRLPGGRLDDGRDLAFKFNDNNWYAQVFNEDFLKTVPASSPRQTQREAKFIIDRLGIESGARVLDLCCGFGRHTLELAKKGFDMVGLDLSMVMLKKALADAQANNQAIKFIHGDMRKLTFKAIFDAIYNVQTSFGYFDDVSNFKVLQGIFNALKPGGVFLIETVNPDFLISDLPLRIWWKGRECMLLEEIDMDALSGVLKVTRSFVFDDQKRAPWEQKIQIRLYTAHEMRALLSRAGFKIVELSGDYSLPGAYFGATSPKIIFVAEKPLR